MKGRFLSDPTGNRRWLPIECHLQDGSSVYEHEEEIKQEIGQALAEMYNAYLNDLPLASPVPNQHELNEITRQQEISEMEDYRIGLIEKYIIDHDKEYVCCVEIWKYALNNKNKNMLRKDSNEIGELLRQKIGCTVAGKMHYPEFGTQHSYKIPDRLRKAAS